MIRIRKTPYMNPKGTFATHSDDVRTQLGVVASAGSADLPASYGDHDDPMDATNYAIVDFDPGAVDTSTASGRVKQRLRDLVTQTTSYEIIGMGWDFVFGDGTTVQVEAGVTLGTTVFYDTTNCNGDGRWIVDTDGNHSCTQSAVVLYHELGGHAFLDQPPDLPTDQAEAQAIHEENDLRVALGEQKRDEQKLDSGCKCPDKGCCIVASVASGSPFSAEVNELRILRDTTLRSSRIGSAFFDCLHREYYSFSHLVCRVMVRSVRARVNVETWLVRPLISILKLARDYTIRPEDFEGLGKTLLAFPPLPANTLREAERFQSALAAGRVEDATMDAGTREVCDILAEWLPRCPHVRWAIIQPLRIYVKARLRFPAGSDAHEAGQWLAEAFNEWLSVMPLEETLSSLMPSEIAAEAVWLDKMIGSARGAAIRERVTSARLERSRRNLVMNRSKLDVRAQQVRCVHRESSLHISLTLKNFSEGPVHAVSELRRIILDPDTGVLTLWLSDRQPPRDHHRPDRHVSRPVTQVIDPGEKSTFEFELPHRMTRIVTGPDNTFDFEPLDLSKTRSVAFRISLDDKPFYFAPNSGSMREQLQKWGRDLETSAQPVEHRK
jgi:hypothetical protein